MSHVSFWSDNAMHVYIPNTAHVHISFFHISLVTAVDHLPSQSHPFPHTLHCSSRTPTRAVKPSALLNARRCHSQVSYFEIAEWPNRESSISNEEIETIQFRLKVMLCLCGAKSSDFIHGVQRSRDWDDACVAKTTRRRLEFCHGQLIFGYENP